MKFIVQNCVTWGIKIATKNDISIATKFMGGVLSHTYLHNYYLYPHSVENCNIVVRCDTANAVRYCMKQVSNLVSPGLDVRSKLRLSSIPLHLLLVCYI